MTIQEAIDELMKVPENKRNLPLYVCDLETSDNFEIIHITLFDSDEEHTDANMLACDFVTYLEKYWINRSDKRWIL